MKTPTTLNNSQIVVYDMDGTLIRGDCGERFIRTQIKSSLWRTALAALVAPIAFLLLRTKSYRKPGVSAFLWVATVGMTKGNYERTLNTFIQNYPLRPLESILMQCRQDIAATFRVVIATGSGQEMASGLLQRLGLNDQIHLVASQTKWFLGGLVASVQCNNEVKLAQLILKGFEPPYLRVYTDSALDLPILLSAQQPILVNASERDRKACRLKCPNLIEPQD